jgi:hypothetical protein
VIDVSATATTSNTAAGPGKWFMTHLAMLDVDERGNSPAWGERVTTTECTATPAS